MKMHTINKRIYVLCLSLMMIFACYSSPCYSSEGGGAKVRIFVKRPDDVGGKQVDYALNASFMDFKAAIAKAYEIKDMENYKIVFAGQVVTAEKYESLKKEIRMEGRVVLVSSPKLVSSPEKANFDQVKKEICLLLFEGNLEEIKKKLQSIKSDPTQSKENQIQVVTAESILRSK